MFGTLRSKAAMAAVIAGSLIALAPATTGSHIAIATVVGLPSSHNAVQFNYEELNTGDCCSGTLFVDYGDGWCGFIGPSLNQDTPQGGYLGIEFECSGSGFRFIGVGVDHPMGDFVANSRLTWEHVYPAFGTYTVTWENCCASNPLPDEVPDRDMIWDTAMAATEGSAVHNQAGSITVLALP